MLLLETEDSGKNYNKNNCTQDGDEDVDLHVFDDGGLLISIDCYCLPCDECSKIKIRIEYLDESFRTQNVKFDDFFEFFEVVVS